VLGETDETATPLPNPTGQTLGPSSQHARLATAVCGPVSSCVDKATDVVRYLPRAGVALPMPMWAIEALSSNPPQKKTAKSAWRATSSSPSPRVRQGWVGRTATSPPPQEKKKKT
jgi:hypothetical protein